MESLAAQVRQARNSAAFWAATADSRGHQVVRRRAFLAVLGDDRAGTRVLIQEPDLSAEEIAEIGALLSAAAGPVDLEDPYSKTDLSHLGLRSWQMPVMERPPGRSPEPALETRVVESAGDLAAAERVVIDSFGLSRFEPYRSGEMFPPRLLEIPGAEVALTLVDGEPAGACVSMSADGYASHYWVGTLDRFRSRGVGRAVMLGSLAGLGDLPLTLTASRLGRPLYESLGYATAGMATWFSST